jgi:hypothetical protein
MSVSTIIISFWLNKTLQDPIIRIMSPVQKGNYRPKTPHIRTVANNHMITEVSFIKVLEDHIVFGVSFIAFLVYKCRNNTASRLLCYKNPLDFRIVQLVIILPLQVPVIPEEPSRRLIEFVDDCIWNLESWD